MSALATPTLNSAAQTPARVKRAQSAREYLSFMAGDFRHPMFAGSESEVSITDVTGAEDPT
jgi:hypothetical protein